MLQLEKSLFLLKSFILTVVLYFYMSYKNLPNLLSALGTRFHLLRSLSKEKAMSLGGESIRSDLLKGFDLMNVKANMLQWLYKLENDLKGLKSVLKFMGETGYLSTHENRVFGLVMEYFMRSSLEVRGTEESGFLFTVEEE